MYLKFSNDIWVFIVTSVEQTFSQTQPFWMHARKSASKENVMLLRCWKANPELSQNIVTSIVSHSLLSSQNEDTVKPAHLQFQKYDRSTVRTKITGNRGKLTRNWIGKAKTHHWLTYRILSYKQVSSNVQC